MIEPKVRPCLLSDIYHILSAPRRCHLIRLLYHRDSQKSTVRELSREIAAIEQETSKSNATGEPYRNVYNALSQTHLQTMADANLITYDNHRQTVASGQCLNTVALFVEFNWMTYTLLRGQSIPTD